MIKIISNGGDPLKDCPTDYGIADKWAAFANRGTEKGQGPVWSWDCGFKLDFDGPIVKFSSRFYPPKTHYGEKWDGSVTVFILGEKAMKKEFECETLKELKEQVEMFRDGIVNGLRVTLSNYRGDKGNPSYS